MARSAKQYENQIKVILVASLAKEFKKADIIGKVISNAKANRQIATKSLINPQLTKSIIPSRNDRWLINKNSVVVKVGSVNYGVPKIVKMRINIEYGLDEKYYWLSEDSSNKRWMPDGKEIMKWIKVKGDRGNFKYKGKPADLSKEYQVKSIGWIISKMISAKGIKKTNILNPFKDKQNGVEATVGKALPSVYKRLNLLYGAELENSIVKIFEVFI